MGQADAEADAIGLLNAGSLDEVDENGGYPLFCPVQGKAFGIVLGFAEAKAEVVDDVDRRFRISLDHVQHGLSVDFDDGAFSHGLGAPGMPFSCKGRRFTAKQIAGHEDFEGDFPAFRGGLHAFHVAVFDNVKPVGRIAFPKNKLSF